MAFDPLHPGQASSATDYNSINNTTQSFAPVHQPYAQRTSRQSQFLPSSRPPSGNLFPFPVPWSQPQAHHASEWRMRHGICVPPRQSPGVNTTTVNSSRAWFSNQNDSMFVPNSLEPTTLASHQALLPMEPDQQLPGWNNSVAGSALYQSLMPTPLVFPTIPMLLEPPAVTVASKMLRTESNASARYLGSHSSFPSGQTWTTDSGSEKSNAVAPYSPDPLQSALWQPEWTGEAFPPPMETTNSPLMFPQEHQSTLPLPIVVGHHDLDSPATTSSHRTHVPTKRKERSSSSQVCIVLSSQHRTF
jgi:hypothetical protein